MVFIDFFRTIKSINQRSELGSKCFELECFHVRWYKIQTEESFTRYEGSISKVSPIAPSPLRLKIGARHNKLMIPTSRSIVFMLNAILLLMLLAYSTGLIDTARSGRVLH